MPLHQLCGTASAKRSASNGSNFTRPAINAQEICEVKVHAAPRPVERCSSQASTLSFSRDICRICHSEDEEDLPLIAPCYCAGSLRFVHQTCLQQWIKSSNTKACELCKFVFIMNSKVKPFSKWERLDMSSVERRKILCSVTFHVITITFVVFSLNVLIQRTSQEVKDGSLEWPFWTKVIVVAIAFTGSIVFVYVQCKMYVQLCRRWRAFNRVIYVQNAPEKMPMTQQKGEDIFRESLGIAYKDGSTRSILDEREKRPVSVSFIANGPSPETNSAMSTVTSTRPISKSPESSFIHECPPGAVDWHEGSRSPIPQSFAKNSDLVHNENELQSLVSLSARSSPGYASTPEIRLQATAAADLESGYSDTDSTEQLNNSRRSLETRFMHPPKNHFSLESAVSSDLSDVETAQ